MLNSFRITQMSIMKFLITYFLNSLSTINFNPPKLQYYVNKVKCQDLCLVKSEFSLMKNKGNKRVKKNLKTKKY